MSAKAKLESWLTETPKNLVLALFALATVAVVAVIVILFLVAPRIASIPNDSETKVEAQPKSTVAKSSRLLTEVSGQTFRNNSTLDMGILEKPSPSEQSEPAETETKSSEESENLSKARLNLEGMSELVFPKSFSSIDKEMATQPSMPSKNPTKLRKTPSKPPDTNQVEAGDPVTFSGLKAFFGDLKTGDFATMQRGCWTITPEVFTDRYTTPPAQYALIEALGNPPEKTEQGLRWSGKHVDVSVSWSELSTRYSCPVVAYGGEPDAVSVPDVTYTMRRLLARTSFPISPSDSERNYPLLCPEWNPPQELIEFNPKAAEKLRLDDEGQINENVFKTLQKLLGAGLKLYTVKNEYPMYLRASESQLKEPSAYFLRDENGSLCIGSVVEKR